MKALALIPLAVLLAACASSGASPPATRSPATKNGPPGAWLETKAGKRWLGFSSFCWRKGKSGVCADAAAPRCGPQGVPVVHVQSGETVRAHLGYTPSEASVDNGAAGLRGRTVTWSVTEAGPFLLYTKGRDGDASYVACARFG
jgi:hypothetical protein